MIKDGICYISDNINIRIVSHICQHFITIIIVTKNMRNETLKSTIARATSVKTNLGTIYLFFILGGSNQTITEKFINWIYQCIAITVRRHFLEAIASL